MRLAVTQSVGKAVETDKPEALKAWVTKEARDLHEQARKAINALNPERTESVTSDGAGTFTTIWTSDEMPQDGVWLVSAVVLGIGATQRASYQVARSFYTTAGSAPAFLSGAAMVLQGETAAGSDARFNIDSTARTVTVEVRDDAAEAMSWSAVVQTFEAVA